MIRKLIRGLRWPAALGLVAWLFSKNADGFDEIASRPLLWSWVAIAMGLRTLAIILGSIRWRLLVRAQDIRFSMRDALRLSFMGNFFNILVPGTVGGDLTKAVMIARENPDDRAVVTATVVLDRVLGLLALLWLGTLAAIMQPGLAGNVQLSSAVLLLAGGSVIGTLGIAAMLHPLSVKLLNQVVRTTLKILKPTNPYGVVIRSSQILMKLMNGVGLYQRRRRVLSVAVLTGLVVHAANVGSYFACAMSLSLADSAPTLATHLLIVPVAELAASVLPLPGGVGAREGALQFLYGAALGTQATSTSAASSGFYVAVGFSLVSLIVAALGGLFALALKPVVRSEAHGDRDDSKPETPNVNRADCHAPAVDDRSVDESALNRESLQTAGATS